MALHSDDKESLKHPALLPLTRKHLHGLYAATTLIIGIRPFTPQLFPCTVAVLIHPAARYL
jgi:hypothetical protein